MRGPPRSRGVVYHLPPMRLGALRLVAAHTRERPQLALPLDPLPRSLPLLDQRERGSSFLSLPVRRVLNPPETTHMPFWSINPYIGCEFGCSYCYARQTHAWTVERAGGAPPAGASHHDFEQRIFVKSSAPEVLLRTLEPARLSGAPLVIGTATDPYQPAERKFRLTRGILQALLHHRGLSIEIITKSPLVSRDIDVLTALTERHDVRVNISMLSVDAELLRRLEARTPAPHARLRALSRLAAAGIRAGVMAAPILPGISDSWAALAALMEAAKEAGARFVTGSALRLGEVARSGFLPVLQREFPDLVARYHRSYGQGPGVAREYERALARRLETLRATFGLAQS